MSWSKKAVRFGLIDNPALKHAAVGFLLSIHLVDFQDHAPANPAEKPLQRSSRRFKNFRLTDPSRLQHR